MSEPTNLLDLTFHTDSKDLAQQLESIPNLQKINHLILKAGDAANLSDFWSLFKNFNEKLDELKVLELNVYVTASRVRRFGLGKKKFFLRVGFCEWDLAGGI